MNPEEYLREEYGITAADDPQPVSLIHDMMYSYYAFHMNEIVGRRMDKKTFRERINAILKLYDYAHYDTDVMEEINNLIEQLYNQLNN